MHCSRFKITLTDSTQVDKGQRTMNLNEVHGMMRLIGYDAIQTCLPVCNCFETHTMKQKNGPDKSHHVIPALVCPDWHKKSTYYCFALCCHFEMFAVII